MRGRILAVALTAVAVAVTLLGLPLAIALQQLVLADERGELQRQALVAAVAVPDDVDHAPFIPLPQEDPSVRLGVYDLAGRKVAGEGPAQADPVVTEALRNRPGNGRSSGDLVAAVPVIANDRVVAAVRATSAQAKSLRQVGVAWVALLGAALAATAAAALLARRQARLLAEPVESLQRAATELGAGNFAVRAPRSGIDEIDRVGQALDDTADRLGALVDRERALAGRASHQLRTPLAALRVRLDNALQGPDPSATLPTAAREALTLVDGLETTIDDLLTLTRAPGAATLLDVPTLLTDVRTRWASVLSAAGRRLVIRVEEGEAEPPPAVASTPAIRQVLDVLVGNAFQHGEGTVTVLARDASGALAIDVVDEGRTPWSAWDLSEDRATPAATQAAAGQTRSGMGLPLARSLLYADRGRLLITYADRRTTATVLLPPAG